VLLLCLCDSGYLWTQTPATGYARRASLDFSQTCLSLPVTNDGWPISARFWQMWDSTAVDRLLLDYQGSRDPLLFRPCAVKGRGPWNPISAKTGQIWATHHSLPTEITPLATIGFLEVREKLTLVIPDGIAENAIILIAQGKIVAVGSHVELPPLSIPVALSRRPHRPA
jgi:hypothetical protein